MKSLDYYLGREQTYLKHFFLERYLERVAYIIGYHSNEFVYVDGFSGPWKSADEKFEDTSFMIALQKLQNVCEGLAKANRFPKIRCLFIEKDPAAFDALEQATKGHTHIEVKALCGQFVTLIPEILRFIGPSFALVFIDPTGWTGFGLKEIMPILKRRRIEIIINFMFDYVNRFITHPGAEIKQQMDELFGGSGWERAVGEAHRSEDAIIRFYKERIRRAGGFAYVTHTRILKPVADRSYFYLVYGTRHLKGLTEFREVEKKFVVEQENVRLTAKQRTRIERTG